MSAAGAPPGIDVPGSRGASGGITGRADGVGGVGAVGFTGATVCGAAMALVETDPISITLPAARPP